MNELDIDNLISKAHNKFLLSNAAAFRAKQIVDGSLPYVNHFDPNNPVVTALRELAADKIIVKVLSGPSLKTIKLTEELPKEDPSALERLAKESKKEPKKKEKKEKKKTKK
ncbi:DNA-directed RNA polymerase subunit omega [Candidatus Saganbacteria bacterium CG08_land_8_20_14_0_20_45_16]|uniref:DNA-directed RNA polymerase subunit omega n=1 Tax=Candidatus Saganbacteria bacterium CG08_land_8_20_14_0_20_45_16 TaxID=2014293 RepID=A0A2H0XUD2_UNCSA|nr:MAG: DNA-directed RNA polymerase subunit omega [Candidatus Saganbacteria bacterium CG08_land_8_20_14_0_20_45_16]